MKPGCINLSKNVDPLIFLLLKLNSNAYVIFLAFFILLAYLSCSSLCFLASSSFSESISSSFNFISNSSGRSSQIS